MKFLLYSINFSPELTGIGKYNGELVGLLNKLGVTTLVVTSPPYYPEWKRHQGYKNWFGKEQYNFSKVYRCPVYVPTKVTTLKRLLHLLSFAGSSALRLLILLRYKPDVVFLVQPTLFCAPIALLYSKFTGAKSVMHIQDFEVDAMFGLGLGKDGLIHKAARKIESWLLKRFDIVSSISYSMLENARTKGVQNERLMFFPNWSDTDFVTPEVDGSCKRAQWGYLPDDNVILYSGNIGQKQGLEVVLKAAEHFKSKANVKFVIIGSGAYSDTLKQLAVEKGLSNVSFKPLQPWEDIPAILSMADVHLVVQKKGAADVVLPSKLTNILSAGGHTLVTAEPHTELGRIELKNPGIFTLVEPENTKAFIDGLSVVLTTDTTKTNHIARQYAVEYLNKDKVIGRFVSDLEARISNTKDLGKTHAN